MPTVMDGVLLPKTPEEILTEKNVNTVPYMVGINKQEFGWIIPTVRTYRATDVPQAYTLNHLPFDVSSHMYF
jgi:carboxylesterase 1